MKYKIRSGVSFILTNKKVLTEGVICDTDKLAAGINGDNIAVQLWKLEPIAELPKILSDLQASAVDVPVKPKSKSKEKAKDESTGIPASKEPDANAANSNS